MLPLLLSAALLVAPGPIQSEGPDPKAVERAVTDLKDAFQKGGPPERVGAIAKAVELVDPTVIAWVAKGLKDAEASVRDAAIEALRFMPHDDALEALEDLAKRDKKLQKEAEPFSKLIKAIGQHGDPRSIALLADGGVTSGTGVVVQARIMSLGNIRTKESVEALIGMMTSGGRERVQDHMANLRFALMRLTGADEGISQDAWIKWWNEHKRELEVTDKPPLLPKDLQLRWDYYWGNPVVRERGKKRGERGDDPEGGGK